MEVNGKVMCVKGKVEGKSRKGQIRGGRCLRRGCGIGGAYERERKQGA